MASYILGTRQDVRAAKHASCQATTHQNMKSQWPTLMDICASWHCNLHEQHFFSPVRILLQEHLKGQKLLWDAFNHIQTVNSQHYLFGKAPTMSRQIPKHISTADVDYQYGRQIA